ncbi:peptidase m12a astacin [Fusarium circinatum]|uniref:Peptidase m12a astacin n=1 Tax=Fusarium circinatum TaxID=48490 RepID=A0A8H5WNT3_FUSCI|nr:peptidase m12a astacin [Fusarium circinatum]
MSSFQADSDNIPPSPHTSHIPFDWLERSSPGITSPSVESIHHGDIPREAQALWIKKEDRWPLGHAITVAFLEQPKHLDADRVTQTVAHCADEWVQGANISFHFLDTTANSHAIENADLQITFQPGISWSVIGTQALGCQGRTMNLAVEPWHGPDEIRRMAFHELGHALGFRHEHASPASNLEFDKEKWMIHTGKTEEDFETNFEKRIDDRPRLVSEFDQQSIMIYEILPEYEWNVKRVRIPLTNRLSAIDQAVVKIAYPSQETNHQLVNGRWYCYNEICRPGEAQCNLCKHIPKLSPLGE